MKTADDLVEEGLAEQYRTGEWSNVDVTTHLDDALTAFEAALALDQVGQAEQALASFEQRLHVIAELPTKHAAQARLAELEAARIPTTPETYNLLAPKEPAP